MEYSENKAAQYRSMSDNSKKHLHTTFSTILKLTRFPKFSKATLRKSRPRGTATMWRRARHYLRPFHICTNASSKALWEHEYYVQEGHEEHTPLSFGTYTTFHLPLTKDTNTLNFMNRTAWRNTALHHAWTTKACDTHNQEVPAACSPCHGTAWTNCSRAQERSENIT